jgi:hypothetical protein
MRFIIVLDVDGEFAAEPARYVQTLLGRWRAALCVPRVWVADIPKADARYAEAMLEQLEDGWGDETHVRAIVTPAPEPSVTFRLLDPRATALLESR